MASKAEMELKLYKKAYADLLEVASIAAGIYCKSEYAGLSWGHDSHKVMRTLQDTADRAPREMKQQLANKLKLLRTA